MNILAWLQLGLRKLIFYKWRFVLLVAMSFAFFIALFPSQDLGIGASRLAHLAGIFLHMESLSPKFAPPGVHLHEVIAILPGLPPVVAKDISIVPGLRLIAGGGPAGSIQVSGFWGGSVSGNVGAGSRSEKGNSRDRVQLSIQNLQVQSMAEAFDLPMELIGHLSGEISGQFNSEQKEQPNGDFALELGQFVVPSGVINLEQTGPMNIPELNLKKVTLKGRVTDGKVYFDSAQIGERNDDIYGLVRGDMSLEFKPGWQTQFGAYRFNVDLNLRQAFADRASYILNLLESYKSLTSEGVRFNVSVSGSAFGGPPSIQKN